ncbi:MAG TPA: hemerythrin domain-containing protein [Acidimicrobiales bacterium]|nr:hemerythrin domain-containing protein [Acidimicrobiales bacterium]
MTDLEVSRPDTSDMVAVHQVLRSSLASAPTLVSSTQGDDVRRALIADYYANLLAFLEVHHDGEETLIFPLLMERAPDARALVTRMATQHAAVLGRLSESKATLTTWSEAGDEAADSATGMLVALADALRTHLDEEEAEILPLAGEHLSMEEWGALPGHAMANFGGDKVWLILGLIRENFTQDQRDAMLERMPPPARAMWETMGESAFKTMISEVRQTA